jgi:hypothetical protein
MKYKFFLMLLLLSSISFMGISSGNEKKELKESCYDNISVKCIKPEKVVKEKGNASQFTSLNQFLLFM